MKYRIGDEVLVKAKIESLFNENLYFAKCSVSSFCVTEEDMESPMTAEEAWEIVRKIIYDVSDDGMTLEELRGVFGTSNYQEILRSYSPQQAKSEIEAWEESKEFKVGDEVVPKEDHYRCGERGIVVCINSVSQIGVNYQGNDFTWYEKDAIQKTGRHINIFGLLEQIGGDD